MPSPRTIGMGFTLACADHEKIVCRLVRSMISAAVMVLVVSMVVTRDSCWAYWRPSPAASYRKGLLGCSVARLRGCEVARLRGCDETKRPGLDVEKSVRIP